MIYTGIGSGTSTATATNVTIASSGVTATGTGTQISKSAYNTSYNQANYVGWTYSGTSQRPSNSINSGTGTASTAYTIANNWLTSNISSSAQAKIASGKFCNDRNVASGSTWAINGSTTFYYAPYDRMASGKTPTLACSNAGDIYTTKVGLITMDEVKYAGGSSSENKNYYLYTGQNYWTMSPNQWYSATTRASMFLVNTSGRLNDSLVDNTWGIRPVINLTTSAIVTGGNGTYQTPYLVS